MITKLINKTYLTENVLQLIFEKPQTFNPKAGQYINIIIDKIARAYSLSGITDSTFELTVELVPNGKMSEKIKLVDIGDQINFVGPIGKFTLDNISQTSDIVFIATGSGIAPMKCIINQLNFELNRKIFLYQGLRFEKDIYYKDYFENIEKLNPSFYYKLCLSKAIDSKDSTILSGHVQDGLNKLDFATLKAPHFFVCGSKEAVLGIADYLRNREVANESIHFERFN